MLTTPGFVTIYYNTYTHSKMMILFSLDDFYSKYVMCYSSNLKDAFLIKENKKTKTFKSIFIYDLIHGKSIRYK